MKNSADFFDYHKPLANSEDFVVVLQEFPKLEKARTLIKSRSFNDVDKLYKCDAYFKIVILKGAIARDNYVIFYLKNFSEIDLIKTSIDKIGTRWNDKEEEDFDISPNDRGDFDYFYLKQTIQSKNIALFIIEFGWADELILKYFFEEISKNTTTIKQIELTPLETGVDFI